MVRTDPIGRDVVPAPEPPRGSRRTSNPRRWNPLLSRCFSGSFIGDRLSYSDGASLRCGDVDTIREHPSGCEVFDDIADRRLRYRKSYEHISSVDLTRCGYSPLTHLPHLRSHKLTVSSGNPERCTDTLELAAMHEIMAGIQSDHVAHRFLTPLLVKPDSVQITLRQGSD